jgi:predicted dehydrogenase
MIRLGVIGCGGMSANFAARVNAIADRLRITAAVDTDLGKARQFASHLPNMPRVLADYRQALDDVDAVLLILPHHLHHPVTLVCLEAGKHVLVEKPLANTPEQCREMIQVAERCNRVLMVAYVMRYHPLVRELKRLLDSGQYGACFHLSIWTEQFTQYPPDHWAMHANTLGGGQLFSHGCHYVDLLLWLLGNPVSGHHVGTNFGTPWMEKEGTSNLAIRFESGAIGYHMGTWGARGTKLGYAIHAHCELGMIEVDFRSGKITLQQFDNCQGLVEPHIEERGSHNSETGRSDVLYTTETGKQTDKELLHFIDCIESGRTPETDGHQSLKSLQIIWRLYDAEQRGVVADLRGLGLAQPLPAQCRGH